MASCGPIGASTPSIGVYWSHSMPFLRRVQASTTNTQGYRISGNTVLQAYQAYSTTRARELVLKGCFVRRAGATQILFSICSGHCALNWIYKIVFCKSVRNRSCNGNERQIICLKLRWPFIRDRCDSNVLVLLKHSQRNNVRPSCS